MIDSKQFKIKEDMNNSDIAILSDDLLYFYAEIFHKGRIEDARLELDSINNKIRTKDAVYIAFLLGACFITLVCLIYFACLPPVGGQKEWNDLLSSIDVYIVTFVVVFVLFSTGACIQIFKIYNVNYAFIFEVDQNYKMIHHQMYKVTLIFFFVWGICWLF